MLQSHESGLPGFLAMDYNPYYLGLVLKTDRLGELILVKNTTAEVVKNTAWNLKRRVPEMLENKQAGEVLIRRNSFYGYTGLDSDVKRKMKVTFNTEKIERGTLLIRNIYLPNNYYPIKGVSAKQISQELITEETNSLLVKTTSWQICLISNGLRELGFEQIYRPMYGYLLLMKGFKDV